MLGIDKPLSKRVKPDNRAPKVRSGSEGLCVGRQRNPQTGRSKVGLKSLRKRRMGRHGGDIGEHVFCGDLSSVPLRENRKKIWLDIGRAGFAIAPQREDAAAAAMIMMKIRNQCSEGRAPVPRSVSGHLERSNKRGGPMRFPQLRIRLIDQSIVWNDPLPIERAKSIAHWSDARALIVRNGLRPWLKAGKALFNHSLTVLVPWFSLAKMRMEKNFLLLLRAPISFCQRFCQRLSIGRDDPGAPRHDPGTVISEQVFEGGVRGPCPSRGRQEGSTPLGRTCQPNPCS